MNQQIIIAGFGGQGVLFTGKFMAYAGLYQGFEVSWLPSYGPEMRGGTCNCLVAASNEQILSPYFVRPTNAVIMNEASMERFLPALDTARVVVVNSSLVNLTPEMEETLKNVHLVQVDATNIAIELGTVKCANMVMLGAYMKSCSVLSVDDLRVSISKKFTKQNVLDTNMQALARGYELA